MKTRLKKIAAEKGIPYQTLIQMWLREKVNQEIKKRIAYRALHQRVKQGYSKLNAKILKGDANQIVEKIRSEMPPFSRSFTVIAFCFADPYCLSDLRFATIRSLAQRRMDFLILIPTMDAIRNLNLYRDPENHTVDDFLGDPSWRSIWKDGKPFNSPVLIRSTEKNLPLYRLGFFSQHRLGQTFWKEVKKYAQAQRTLFENGR